MGIVALALVAVGCADEEVPSCQQAMTHYYGSGCLLLDGRTNPPTPYSVNESTLICKDVGAIVPDRCQSYFDDWMFCLNDMPANASDAQCIACTQEQDALFGCQ